MNLEGLPIEDKILYYFEKDLIKCLHEKNKQIKNNKVLFLRSSHNIEDIDFSNCEYIIDYFKLLSINYRPLIFDKNYCDDGLMKCKICDICQNSLTSFDKFMSRIDYFIKRLSSEKIDNEAEFFIFTKNKIKFLKKITKLNFLNRFHLHQDIYCQSAQVIYNNLFMFMILSFNSKFIDFYSRINLLKISIWNTYKNKNSMLYHGKKKFLRHLCMIRLSYDNLHKMQKNYANFDKLFINQIESQIENDIHDLFWFDLKKYIDMFPKLVCTKCKCQNNPYLVITSDGEYVSNLKLKKIMISYRLLPIKIRIFMNSHKDLIEVLMKKTKIRNKNNLELFLVKLLKHIFKKYSEEKSSQ